MTFNIQFVDVHLAIVAVQPTGSERRLWVDSRRLEKSYLELVSTSEFGVTTDIHQAPGHVHVIGPVLLSSANSGHSRDSGELPSCSNSGRSRPATNTHTLATSGPSASYKNGDPKVAVNVAIDVLFFSSSRNH
jgi:hypothetical protein